MRYYIRTTEWGNFELKVSLGLEERSGLFRFNNFDDIRSNENPVSLTTGNFAQYAEPDELINIQLCGSSCHA